MRCAVPGSYAGTLALPCRTDAPGAPGACAGERVGRSANGRRAPQQSRAATKEIRILVVQMHYRFVLHSSCRLQIGPPFWSTPSSYLTRITRYVDASLLVLSRRSMMRV